MSYEGRVQVYIDMDKKFGSNKRVSKIIEELSELVKELSKVGQGSKNAQKLCDEIADVKIGLEQLEMFYAPNKNIIEQIMDFKVVRTKAFYLSSKDEKLSDCEVDIEGNKLV